MCSINYWWFYLKGLANITIVWATNHFSWILVEEGWVILQLLKVTGYHSSIHNPHSSTIQYIFFLRNSHVRSSVRIRNHSLGLIDVPFSPGNPFRYFSTSWKVPLRRARPTAMSRFSKWKEKEKKNLSKLSHRSHLNLLSMVPPDFSWREMTIRYGKIGKCTLVQ